MKLNILLAKTDALASQFKATINDYSKFFKSNQGSFIGGKNTYVPREGTIDEPTKRGNKLVASTVDEKFDYLVESSKDYIDALFSQEKTNASGLAVAELIVDGESWGKLTSLELLRLKNLVDSTDVYNMIKNIPTRSDSEEWTKTKNEMYENREGIFESPTVSGVNVTTQKEEYILKDPNINTTSEYYSPVKSAKTTMIELGDYTMVRFSGEWSHRRRAESLKRRSTLVVAIIEALKKCNEAESVQSELTSDKIFGYLL